MKGIVVNVVKKPFKGADTADHTSISVEVKISDKTKQELFDEAVKEVVKDRVRPVVIEQLSELCYDEETVKQTNQAVEEFGRYLVGETLAKAREKFPKCVWTRNGYSVTLGLPFNLDLFVDNIIGDL